MPLPIRMRDAYFSILAVRVAGCLASAKNMLYALFLPGVKASNAVFSLLSFAKYAFNSSIYTKSSLSENATFNPAFSISIASKI